MQWIKALILLLFLVGSTFSTQSALAQKHIALVVGNNAYSNLAPEFQLQKAVNDANAVAEALASIGFEVIRATDVAQPTMEDTLNGFFSRVKPGDTALFYFAGHGVSLNGANYILPADVPTLRQGQDQTLRGRSFSETDIIASLQERRPRAIIMILDSCRNNPFRKEGLKRAVGDLDRGLSRIPEASGVFSLYSAGFGQAALDRLSDDDANPNSVFTRVLLPRLTRPGLNLDDLAFEVREEVSDLASKAQGAPVQTPAALNQIVGGRVYLAGPDQNASPAPSGITSEVEAAQVWASLRTSEDEDELNAFAKKYDGTIAAASALRRLKQLAAKRPVIVEPAPPKAPANETTPKPATTPIPAPVVPPAPLPVAPVPSPAPQIKVPELARVAPLAVVKSLPADISAARISESAGTTLRTVAVRGNLLCGVNTGYFGFSAPNDKGEWAGFDVDYCRAIATAIFGDPFKVKFIPLSAKERFVALQSGEIDVLARNSTWTISRDTTMGLENAGVNYYDGQGLMVRKSVKVSSALELSGAAVCVQQDTTTEQNLADYFRAHNMPFTKVTFVTTDETVLAYDSGRCDVLTNDASGLYNERLRLKAPDENIVLPELISREPLGPYVRQGDNNWADIVRWVHFALLTAEEEGVTQANVDDMLKSDSPSIRRLLGVEGDFGRGIGVDDRWAYLIIKALGNYGEIFDRNLGAGSPLKIERGHNMLWNRKGGLQFAPPIR